MIRDRLLALLAAAAVASAGCGSSGSPSPASSADGTSGPGTTGAIGSPASASPTVPSPGASPTTPPASGPAATGSPLSDRPDLQAARVDLEPIVGGLDQPLLAVDPGDGAGRLFVVEQPGRIRIVRDGSLVDGPFLDIADRVSSGGERGLLGLAFPPGFGSTRETFYVDYTNRDGTSIVAEYRVGSAGADRADRASERVLLQVPQPYANHNGGWIGFDADGMLLVSLGDGGSGGDPEGRGQRLDTLLAKILRLDVLGATADGAYAIPADNPFVGRADAKPEIAFYGLRNPWRLDVDPATGDLWIADVGQSRWEEVDVARRGALGLDFGWNRLEGNHCYDPPSGCDRGGTTLPIAEYSHDRGCSISGGIAYRGRAIPALRGAYLFSDYCSGTLWAIDTGLDAGQAPVVLLETGRRIAGFGRDAAGEAYLLDISGGELLRLVPAG